MITEPERKSSTSIGTRKSGFAVSRPGSLGFRLSFVFPVVHLFPLVVSQYYNPVQLTAGPSQIRTCHFLASGSQTSLVSLTHSLTAQCNQVDQTTRIGQGVGFREAVEIAPVHIALLAPAAEVAFGHHPNARTVSHQ